MYEFLSSRQSSVDKVKAIVELHVSHNEKCRVTPYRIRQTVVNVTTVVLHRSSNSLSCARLWVTLCSCMLAGITHTMSRDVRNSSRRCSQGVRVALRVLPSQLFPSHVDYTWTTRERSEFVVSYVVTSWWAYILFFVFEIDVVAGIAACWTHVVGRDWRNWTESTHQRCKHRRKLGVFLNSNCFHILSHFVWSSTRVLCIYMRQVNRCESLLNELKTLIRRKKKSPNLNCSEHLQTLREEYLSLLPRHPGSNGDITLTTIREVAREQNVCQVRHSSWPSS